MRYLEHVEKLRRDLIVNWYRTDIDQNWAFHHPEKCELARFLTEVPNLHETALAYFAQLAESVLKSPHAMPFLNEWIDVDPVAPYQRFLRDLVSQLAPTVYSRWSEMPAMFKDGWCLRVAEHVIVARGIIQSGCNDLKAALKQ